MAQTKPSPITIALVRVDGALVPFATWADGKWTPSLLRSGQSSGFSRRWTVLRVDSGESLDVTVGSVGDIASHCESLTALLTNLPRKPVNEHEAPWPLFGAGIDARAIMTVVTTADRTGAAWRDAGRILASRSFRLEKLYSAGESDGTAWYFTARRRLPHGANAQSEQLLSGWLVRQSNGALRIVASHVTEVQGDDKVARTLEPVATVTIDGRTYWLARSYGYEDERWEVIHIQRHEVSTMLDVPVGGC